MAKVECRVLLEVTIFSTRRCEAATSPLNPLFVSMYIPFSEGTTGLKTTRDSEDSDPSQYLVSSRCLCRDIEMLGLHRDAGGFTSSSRPGNQDPNT